MTGNRPLYSEARNASPQRDGNNGLWYDKFYDRWSDALFDLRKPPTDQSKADWISAQTRKACGEVSLLEDMAERRAALVNRCKGRSIVAVTTERFVSGLGRAHPVENGFAWHHVLGVPYLPGSSVKGLVGAWARSWEQAEKGLIDAVFGKAAVGNQGSRAGSVAFLDALPLAPVQLDPEVMTPHYGPYYADGKAPGDWHNPVPIPFLAVAPGQAFSFALLPCGPAATAEENLDQAAAWLTAALETLGAGAKTNVGYGRFEVAASSDSARPLAVSVKDRYRPRPASPNQAEPLIPMPTVPSPEAEGEAGEIRVGQRVTIDGEPAKVISLTPEGATLELLDSGDIEVVGLDEIDR